MKLTPQEKLILLRELDSPMLSAAFVRALEIYKEKIDKLSKEMQSEYEGLFKEYEKKKNKLNKELVDVQLKTKDGEKGEKGDRGDKGDRGERGVQGIPGERGNDGKDGKDGKDGNDGSPDKPIEIADKLNTLDEKVEMGVIKGLKKTLVDLSNVIRDRKGGGSGGGGGMGNVVHQSFAVTSATTSITLSNNVAGNGYAIWAYYNGQFIVRGTAYTVSGKTLSLLFTPSDSPSSFIDVIYIRA